MGAEEDMAICAAFCAVVELGQRRGVERVNQLAGCWEVKIDERWWFALNGHEKPTPCAAGVDVEPFSVYVTYNGWPAGMFNPRGGWIAAGEGANEDAFIAAVRGAS
jgi:hypothetical protein